MKELDSELLNLDCLTKWLHESELISKDTEVEAEPLAGGASNALFVLNISGGRSWVLRRPRLVASKNAGRGIVKEYRFLKALFETPVAVPEPIALCEDAEILGCEFLIMSRLDGFNPAGELPALFSDKKPEIALAMVDMLAEIHNVDYAVAGLSDLDRTEGFHQRQQKRWMDQLLSYEGRQIAGLEDVGSWIYNNMPKGFEPCIMHADFHMMNVLIASDLPVRVAGVLDWETSTIGDPMLDLAGFLEIWCPAYPAEKGWLAEAELIKRYIQKIQRQINMEELNYYKVLYNFRMTVLLEGIYQRSLLDSSAKPTEGIAERALYCADRASQIISDI